MSSQFEGSVRVCIKNVQNLKKYFITKEQIFSLNYKQRRQFKS